MERMCGAMAHRKAYLQLANVYHGFSYRRMGNVVRADAEVQSDASDVRAWVPGRRERYY